MIVNSRELLTTVRHLSSLTDMLTAMYLDAKEQDDFSLFPLTSDAYFVMIREINAELREYLRAHPEATELVPPEPVTSARGRQV